LLLRAIAATASARALNNADNGTKRHEQTTASDQGGARHEAPAGPTPIVLIRTNWSHNIRTRFQDSLLAILNDMTAPSLPATIPQRRAGLANNVLQRARVLLSRDEVDRRVERTSTRSSPTRA